MFSERETNKNIGFYCVFATLVGRPSQREATPAGKSKSQTHEVGWLVGWLAGWLAGLPALVAETIRFTDVFAPGIKKTLVFIAFEQLWSGDQEKTISFTVVFQYWVKNALVFIVF